MALTKQALREKVLQRLLVLAAGESGNSADAQLVEDEIDYAIAEHDDLVSFVSSAIPEWSVDSFGDYIAARSARPLGVPFSMSKEDALARFIHARNRRFGVGAQPEVEYF